MSGPLFTNLWRAYLKEFYELGKSAQRQGLSRRPMENDAFRQLIAESSENKQRKMHAYRVGYDIEKASSEYEQ